MREGGFDSKEDGVNTHLYTSQWLHQRNLDRCIEAILKLKIKYVQEDKGRLPEYNLPSKQWWVYHFFLSDILWSEMSSLKTGNEQCSADRKQSQRNLPVWFKEQK